MNVEQRLQESWWAGTQYKVRKDIDSKWATAAATIKNEFMSECIKSQYFSFSYHEIICLTIFSKLQDYIRGQSNAAFVHFLSFFDFI